MNRFLRRFLPITIAIFFLTAIVVEFFYPGEVVAAVERATIGVVSAIVSLICGIAEPLVEPVATIVILALIARYIWKKL